MMATDPSTLPFVADEKVIISSLVVILVTATLVSLVFKRLRLAIIPAFIVAGIIAGPFVLGFARSGPALEEISHLAVVLLLFGVGMELHLSSLRTGIWRLLSASLGAILLSLLFIGLVGVQLGLTPIQSLTAAMALSLSSTAVVLRTLTLRRELATSHGQLSVAILVTQDLAVLGMLALLPILATWGGTLSVEGSTPPKDFWDVLGEASIMLTGIIALVLLAHKIIPSLLREAVRDQTGELPMLVGVAIALLTAYASQELGFSLEMGAFLAGFVLASSPFRFHLAGRISALRDLFMAIFFTTLGMELNLSVVFDQWFIILNCTILLFVVKILAISSAIWASGISARLAVRVGLALSQAGEFSLILISQASGYAIFDEVSSSIMLAVVVLSLILTPAVFSLSPKLYGRIQPTLMAPWFNVPWQGELRSADVGSPPRAAEVVVAGYGPLGQKLAEKLQQCGIRYTIVELNPDTVRREQANNRPIVFGDVSTDHVLNALQIETSQALLLTLPDPRSSIVASSLARTRSAKLLIIARAPTQRDKQALLEAGADYVVVDEDASADEIFSVVSAANLRKSGVASPEDFSNLCCLVQIVTSKVH